MADDTSRIIGPIILLGSPGAGKGTQAKLIAAALRDPAGFDRRSAAGQRQPGHPAGLTGQVHHGPGRAGSGRSGMRHGGRAVAAAGLRPGLHFGWLSAHASSGWLAGCFLGSKFFDKPKSDKSAQAWLPIVVRIDVDYNELLLRLTGRRTCPTCGRIYNIHFQPPRVDELCDFDGLQADYPRG